MDLDFLRPLYDGTGGYVSVYLDTSRDHQNAAHEIAVRWADARERLVSAGPTRPPWTRWVGRSPTRRPSARTRRWPGRPR